MKLLAVCSTTNFPNFTRRATVEAIADQIPGTELLLFNGFKAQFDNVKSSDTLMTQYYHNWLPGTLSESGLFGSAENYVRSFTWRKYFKQYDIIFLSDPNQHLLLDYIEKETPVIYLIRDPNILQDTRNRDREEKILKRAELVLATSRNLAEKYIPKYYGWNHPNVVYWPNCVDLDLWSKKDGRKQASAHSKIGVAGNFSPKRTDYHLLETLADELPNVTIEIAGKIDREEQRGFWEPYLKRKNVRYLGFIPHEELPQTVAKWKVGMVTDRICEYTSYMHHNKVYQYLAMGVPVVSLRLHEDFEPLAPYVCSTADKDSFIQEVKVKMEKQKSTDFRDQCILLAKENSSQNRANHFKELLKKAGWLNET